MGKAKAWREAGKRNTIEGEFTERQIKAFVRTNTGLSTLAGNLLQRFYRGQE